MKNPNLLFAGTEYGVFASIDGGAAGSGWRRDLPTVPVHDLVIHPRDGDLIAATHGRSIWILDDITPLQQLSPEVLTSDAHLFRAASRRSGAASRAARRAATSSSRAATR